MGARWTTAELATLRRMAGVATTEQIARTLGRTVPSIKRAGADHRISLRPGRIAVRLAPADPLVLLEAVVLQARADAETDVHARAWLSQLGAALGN